MKINFNQKLKNFQGEVIKETTDKDSEDLTLKAVCIIALTANIIGEQVNGKEKYKRWKLARRVEEEDKEDFTVEEIAKIKELIGKAFGVVVVGQAWEMLEKEQK